MSSRRWGIILAGGDGTRLREVSRLISGDNRPKQFCSLLGSKSLLARTRGRLAPAISPERLIFAVVRAHEQFYRHELADVDESRIVVQPANRGTTAAIIYSLLRVTRLERDPVVAFFPADHHFADEGRFAHAVDGAFEAARTNPESLVLLGARAEKAEVEYGWIEPGPRMETERGSASRVFRVNRFWEKPSAPLAQDLLDRGCLWNTFVIAGLARTFLEVVGSAIPHILSAFQPIALSRSKDGESQHAAALYEALPAGDFSHQVLAQCPERLTVLRMDDAGWGDLGTPEGVLAAMQGSGPVPQPCSPAFNSWLAAYRHRLEEVCQRSNGQPAPAEWHHR